MKYKKIEIVFDEAKDRFTRTLLVKENTNLVILGCIFCTALKTQFEHNFTFIKNKVEYLPDAFIAEGVYDKEKEVAMKKYNLKHLGNKFQFLYDTGDYWLFNCKVTDSNKEPNGNKLAYLIDGKGQGVWEDNKYSLMSYIEGEIGPEFKQEDEDLGYCLPWNFDNNQYSDFDYFDIEEEKEIFDETLIKNINLYLDGHHSAGFEVEVKRIKDKNNPQVANLYNIKNELENLDNLVINKTDTSFLSSIKSFDKKYAEEYMEENGLSNYKEWMKDSLNMFKYPFTDSINHPATVNFFYNLVKNENTNNLMCFAEDVKNNVVFLYRENGELKYYIPDEIKSIMLEVLLKMKKYN